MSDDVAMYRSDCYIWNLVAMHPALPQHMIEGVKASLDIIGTSMCDLAAECKLHRLQEDAHAEAQVAVQAYAVSSSPQCRHKAMQHLQQTKTYLDADRMVALIDLVSLDTIAATAYLSLE